MQDNRKEIIRRLEEDLIGPRFGKTEALFDRPSDTYLTGILYPKKTKIDKEEDDGQDETISRGDTSSDDFEKGISAFRNFKPATAGISFAITGPNKDATSVQLSIKFGAYKRHRTFELLPSTTDDEARETLGKLESRQKYFWQRTQNNVIKQIHLNNEISRIPLSDEGWPNLSIFIKTKKLTDKRIVTVQFINEFEPTSDTEYFEIEEQSLFQFGLELTTVNGDSFAPRQSIQSGSDEDSLIANLIYRKNLEYATGHNCSATWELKSEPKKLSTSWMPQAEVKPVSPDGNATIASRISKTSIGKLSAEKIHKSGSEELFELLHAVTNGYKDWIEKQKINSLEKIHQEQANKNLEHCKKACQRITEGVEYLKNNPDALQAFRFANLAMRVQKSWSDGSPNWDEPGENDLIWRPFQLAFVLLCLPSSSERSHPERDVFDLIWFPTGGGKTEAYLLLSAYVLALRRLRLNSQESGGVSVIMRYTLRTLTVQQFQRASAMILACEILRREKYPELGQEQFSIGLWVGDSTTPNKRADAFKRLRERSPISTPAQLKNCPICTNEKVTLNWKQDSDKEKVKCLCPADMCLAKKCEGQLPILTVDEDIYENPPSLVIGTVDKFAQIVRNKKTGAIFGIGTTNAPPDLIIQDELHLISGPLGSLTGLYELAIDDLCSDETGPPKIIGSTATIKQALEQVRALYNRQSFQFPPAALEDGDSGFANIDDNKDGRLYVGLSTVGRSPKFVLQAIAASLLQSGISEKLAPKNSDFYTTLISYYNSLKELGGALVVMQDDVPKMLQTIAKQRGEKLRNIAIPEELTSRKSSAEIPEILDRLGNISGSDDFVDVLLASNMLSVGVDIPRLGMMLVNGQPKSMSEYIQVTSRVGRAADGPGLVVTIYNNNKIRDRSHFETFNTWHSSLYRSVEATSVTPFASRARDKALHAPLIALVRHQIGISQVKLTPELRKKIEATIIPKITQRVNDIDPRETESAEEELQEFLDYWEERSGISTFWNDANPVKSLLISAEKEAGRIASGEGSYVAKSTPNSLRNIEPSTLFKIAKKAKKSN